MRKKTAKKCVTFIIWSAYLLADWAASFAVGLVFDTEEKYASAQDKGDDAKGAEADTGLLLVLWIPFLLLMVGGQDRITSFAVQDNELWHRHLIWLFLQLCTTGFVFIQSVHQNRLWIPTLLLLIAGTIKYAERIVALYLASSDSFGTSVLKDPNPGPNYEKLMREFKHYEDSNVPVYFAKFPDIESGVVNVKYDRFYGDLSDSELVQYAHRFANMYKGLIVNLMFSSREHKESREFFSNRTAEDALRILEIELNIFYDLLHTKVEANLKLGKMVRYMPFGFVVSALALFHKKDKYGFKSFDLKLTYILFFGFLGLDVVTELLWMFSDWSTVSSLSKDAKYFPLAKIQSKIFNELLSLKRPRWKWKETNAAPQENHWWVACTAKILERLKPKSKESEKEPPYATQKIEWQEASTPIMFKRWSETLSQFNFIAYFCKESGSEGIFRIIMTNMPKSMHIKDFIEQKKNDIFLKRSVIPQPLPKKLWGFIFQELLEKSTSAHDDGEAKRISLARGDWILENGVFFDDDDSELSRLMPYVKDVAYDESLLLWHIATELCTANPPDNTGDEEAFMFSQWLSNYMMYLLYQQPNLMSEVSGIAKQRFRDTLAEAQRFFSQRQRRRGQLVMDYQRILDVDTSLKPADVKGNLSKSALFDATRLAKELNVLGERKWKVMSKVWVELLSYAASRSRGNGHVQQLSRGGELLTFVWLLMAHLGLRESWVETRIRTRLIVSK
ncbi:hypothetical protein SO802_013438 [Lithocarpus litseifolius]|uniref:DUF4220 domain-containing protein n=1 Tax=Lithocarpus litseifolius TaxID=425828 RepID=A0AAW2D664_9ROSI